MLKTYAAALACAAMFANAAAQDSFGGQPQQPQQQSFPQQGNPPGMQQPMPQGYPAQPGYPQQQQRPPMPGFGGVGADLDQLAQQERQDFGVQPTSQLHAGQMHGPTPASIPGGQVITTKGLVELVQGRQTPFLIFDVLGGNEIIPGALAAAPASQPGSYNDQTQQQFGGYLHQATNGVKQTPLVFYCLSNQCWMSYNAALRAINMGYTNVLWYRGGIEAWKAAGQQTQNPYQSASQGQQPQGGQPY
ncbi:MAG: rhodanese-like domain-containing protein [Parvularculaceae bacterium]